MNPENDERGEVTDDVDSPERPLEQLCSGQGIYYKHSMYLSFGNAGKLYRYNFLVKRWQLVASQDLGVKGGVACFLIGGKYVVAGGNNGLFTPSTDKAWMIDLDAYPE